MNKLKIAVSQSVVESFITDYEKIDAAMTDFTNVAAVVGSREKARELLASIDSTGFEVPFFLALKEDEEVPEGLFNRLSGVIQIGRGNRHHYGRKITAAADKYVNELYPPFFRALTEYVKHGNSAFDCPGHQGGQFFTKHPLGRQFFHFFGETLFRADLCNADVKLGDLLIHEGAALDAQMNAARIYNAADSNPKCNTRGFNE